MLEKLTRRVAPLLVPIALAVGDENPKSGIDECCEAVAGQVAIAALKQVGGLKEWGKLEKMSSVTANNTVEEIVVIQAYEADEEPQKIEAFIDSIDTAYEQFVAEVKRTGKINKTVLDGIILKATGLKEVIDNNYRLLQASVLQMGNDGTYNCAAISAYVATVLEKLVAELPEEEQQKYAIDLLYENHVDSHGEKVAHRYVGFSGSEESWLLDMNGVWPDDGSVKAVLPLRDYKRALLGEEVLVKTEIPFNSNFRGAGKAGEGSPSDKKILFQGGLPVKRVQETVLSNDPNVIDTLEKLQGYLEKESQRAQKYYIGLDLSQVRNITPAMAFEMGKAYGTEVREYAFLFSGKIAIGDLSQWSRETLRTLFFSVNKNRYQIELTIDVPDERLPDNALNDLVALIREMTPPKDKVPGYGENFFYIDVRCKKMHLPYDQLQRLVDLNISLHFNYPSLSEQELTIFNGSEGGIFGIDGRGLTADVISKVQPNRDRDGSGFWKQKIIIEDENVVLSLLADPEKAQAIANNEAIGLGGTVAYFSVFSTQMAYRLAFYNPEHRYVRYYRDMLNDNDENVRMNSRAQFEENAPAAAKELGVTVEELKAKVGYKE